MHTSAPMTGEKAFSEQPRASVLPFRQPIDDEYLRGLMLEARYGPGGPAEITEAQLNLALAGAGPNESDPQWRIGLVSKFPWFRRACRRFEGGVWAALNLQVMGQEPEHEFGAALRPDQRRALSRMLQTMWGAPTAKILKAASGGHWILVPEPYDHLQRPQDAFQCLISGARLLRELRGEDLQAYGAQPWAYSDEQRRAMGAAAASGPTAPRDPEEWLQMEQQGRRIGTRRRALAERRRDLRRLLAVLERDEHAMLCDEARLRERKAAAHRTKR